MKSRIKIGVFIILIFGFSIVTVLVPKKKFSASENRYLAQRPSFTFSDFKGGTFSKNYETYVTDQFPERDKWIKLKVYSEKFMQKKDVNGVFFAKDDYLIAKHTEEDFDQTLIEKNISRLNEFLKKYKEEIKNPINVMMVPTSSQVLKDKLPSFAPVYDQDAFIEEVESSMADGMFINAGNTLRKHKEEYIYYRTDHHWTTLGAYYAYEQWAKANGFIPLGDNKYEIETASDNFFGTTYSKVNVGGRPDEIKLYQFLDHKVAVDINEGQSKMDTLYDRTYLKEKDQYSTFLGGNNAYVKVMSNVSNKRRLLVIKDSFAHSFVPFVTNHYEEVIMLDYRYFNGSTEQVIRDNEITDVLVLYSTVNFAQDKYFGKILN